MTTERTEELKPCPLCGDKDDYNPSVSQSYGYAEPGDTATGSIGNPSAGLIEKGHYVECDKCGCCGPHKDTPAEAIAAWNTRSLTPQAGEGVVERVARAIAESFERGSPDIAAGMRMDWQTWVPEARAAIAALPPAGRVEELEKAGNALAETLKIYKASLVQALTRRELSILMENLHNWNLAALNGSTTHE